MLIKLAQLKNLEAPLSKLMDQHVPVKTSFKLSKVLKQVASELQDLEESRQKLIKTYGELNEEAQTISITDPAKLIDFQKEYSELLNVEIELNYDPLSIEALGDSLELSVSEVVQLSVLFKDE